jgi:hypothetical protein
VILQVVVLRARGRERHTEALSYVSYSFRSRTL